MQCDRHVSKCDRLTEFRLSNELLLTAMPRMIEHRCWNQRDSNEFRVQVLKHANVYKLPYGDSLVAF
jgi:hypothetical protein